MNWAIVGLEKIDSVYLDKNSGLKLIVKRGSGVDNIDLAECKKRGVMVSRTPDAPANAVAELTICQMLNMLRKVQNVSNQLLNQEKWNRYIGRELSSCKIGIIGLGRIGKLVFEKLMRWTQSDMLHYNDLIVPDKKYGYYKPLNEILTTCDIITLHIPLKNDEVDNTNFISIKELNMMKPNVRLLNMSRGGIINEPDLITWLKTHLKACVALDSYVEEAYHGELCKLGNVYLTPHIGSCTVTSKERMHSEAVEEVQRFVEGKPLKERII